MNMHGYKNYRHANRIKIKRLTGTWLGGTVWIPFQKKLLKE